MRNIHNYLPQVLLVIIIVGVGMLSTIVPWSQTPTGRVFTGMNGYASDYTQYVSYIKEGMYGRYSMLFRSFPFPQPQTPIHFFYIATGVIAGFLGMNAPLAFHVLRIILGSLYVILTYKLFRNFCTRHIAFIGTILAFVSTPLGLPKFSFFNFSIIHPERVTDRPHYVFGAVIFLLIILAFIGERRKKSGFLFVFSFLASMVHTSVGILLLILSALTLSKSTFLGSVLALGVTYFFVKQYTLVPEIWLDSYVYAGAITLAGTVKDILSFGPTLWLGLVGLFWERRKHKTILLWLCIQLGLFLFGYRFFHADRVRFLQSLYFIPMTYGTILFFQKITKYTKQWVLPAGLGLMILLSLPVYTQDLQGSLTSLTDYKTFSPFVFPTKQQFEAYQFLNMYSQKESIVLAGYEAASNLLLYSHNMVIGNDQGWSKDKGQAMLSARDVFFRGTLPEDIARGYLTQNNIDYIYYGYQERSFGDISHYKFLQSVFSNNEVTIYRVQ